MGILLFRFRFPYSHLLQRVTTVAKSNRHAFQTIPRRSYSFNQITEALYGEGCCTENKYNPSKAKVIIYLVLKHISQILTNLIDPQII